MRKKISILVLAVLMMFSLTGCKKAGDTDGKTRISMNEGQQLYLNVSASAEDEWKSDDETVVTAVVTSGGFVCVTAKSEGTAEVKNHNKSGGKVYRIQVNLAAVESFEFENAGIISINLSDSQYAQVAIKDILAKDLSKDFTFSVEDKSLADVDLDGKVRARKVGVTSLYATHTKSGVSKKATVVVTGNRGKSYLKKYDTDFVGTSNHVQGVAADSYGDYFYYSFTDRLIKQNADGEVVGSVIGFGGTGHLGDVSFNESDGRLYASYVTKISYGVPDEGDNARKNCYVLIFDVDKITAMDMSPAGIVTSVYVGEPIIKLSSANGYGVDAEDIRLGGKYGALNVIDSMAFGARFGEVDGKKYLTLGIGTVSNGASLNGKFARQRTDNDYIVLVQFDTDDWAQYEEPYATLEKGIGPSDFTETYFYYFGYHDYGIQNIMYDEYQQVYFLSGYGVANDDDGVQFPSYMLYILDANTAAEEKTLIGNGDEKGKVVTEKYGILDAATGIRGYDPSYSVGMLSMGDGYYYISKNYSANNNQGATLTLYKWNLNSENQETETNPIAQV